MKRIVAMGLGMIALLSTVKAQPGYKWPEDAAKRDKAQEYLVTMSDDLNAKTPAIAVPKVEWLLENCPDVHKSLYVNGSKVYESMVDAEKDPTKLSEYKEKALRMYDLRIQYYGDEANVLNRKGQKAWVYWNDRKEKTEELFNLYKKIFELNGNASYAPNTIAYMDMACKMKSIGKLNDEQVMEVYDIINSVIDSYAGTPDEEKYSKMRELVDGKLSGCVTVDCEFVKNNLVPKYKASKDIKLAKKIYSLMVSGGCTSDDMFIQVMKDIDEKEPSCGMKITIARKALHAEKYDEAINYFNKCLQVCGNEKKGEIYFELALIYKKRGDKITARDYAQKSIGAGDSHKSQSYDLIGDLYFQSFDDCKNTSLVKSRALYIAAYDMYKNAGNSKMMATAKAQFPSMAEIFTENMTLGQSVTVGCWINQTVALDKRPE